MSAALPQAVAEQMEWPFFDDFHRTFLPELDQWAQQHLQLGHEDADVI